MVKFLKYKIPPFLSNAIELQYQKSIAYTSLQEANYLGKLLPYILLFKTISDAIFHGTNHLILCSAHRIVAVLFLWAIRQGSLKYSRKLKKQESHKTQAELSYIFIGKMVGYIHYLILLLWCWIEVIIEVDSSNWMGNSMSLFIVVSFCGMHHLVQGAQSCIWMYSLFSFLTVICKPLYIGGSVGEIIQLLLCETGLSVSLYIIFYHTETRNRKNFVKNEKLKYEKGRINTFIDMVPEPIIEYRLNEGIHHANQAYYKFLAHLNCSSFEEFASHTFLKSNQEINLFNAISNVLQYLSQKDIFQSDQLIEDCTYYDHTNLKKHSIENEFKSGVKRHSKGKDIEIRFCSIKYKPNSILLILNDIPTFKKLQHEKIERKYKTIILRSLSHDLKTPLNGVVSLLQDLTNSLQKNLSKKENAKLEIISNSIKLLEYKIDDLLDYSRIELKEFFPQYSPFSLYGLINEIMDLIDNQAQMAKVKCEVIFEDDVPSIISSDYKRLKQIIIHLLLNAIKYTCPEGSVLLHVIKVNEKIQFLVNDTGIGMDKKTRESIFGLFGLENKNDSPFLEEINIKTGLGLKITQKLCEGLGSQLQFLSKKRKGSTFWFSVNIQSNNQTLVRGSRSFSMNSPGSPEWDSLGFSPSREVLDSSIMRVTSKDLNEAEAFLPIDEISPLVFSRKISIRKKKQINYRSRNLINPQKVIEISSPPHFERDCEIPKERLDNSRKNFCFYCKETEVALPNKAYTHRIFKVRKNIPKSKSLIHNKFGSYRHFRHLSVPNVIQPIKSLLNSPPKKSGKIILVVDDNSVNRSVASLILKKQSFQTEEAINGKDAVERVISKYKNIESEFFSLILMDLDMPEMNGLEATAILVDKMKKGIIPTIPIIALTAFDVKEVGNSCTKAGMKECIMKPLTCQTVRNICQKYIFP